MKKESVILEKSLEFSLGIIQFSEHFEERKKYVEANQLLKYGTSLGANFLKLKMLKVRLIL